MFDNSLSVYMSISAARGWGFNYVWGEPTHFVHLTEDLDGPTRPLNKEWSVSISLFIFYINISFYKNLRDAEEE